MRILLVLFLFLPLFADDEIVVHLTTKEQLTPLFIAPIEAAGSGFGKEYVASLEKVLRFDFAHDGKTEVLASGNNAAKVEVQIKQKALKVKFVDAYTRSIKGVEGINLTGTLSTDRHLMHKIHDLIYESLFQEKGIAQTKLLFTLRNRKTDNSSDWESDVWEVDYDGANARKVTHEGSLCVTPTFVPAPPGSSCRDFLYVSYKLGQPKIYAASLEEGAGKRVSFLRGNQFMPTLSPALDKIAFISDITGNPDLFVQDFSLDRGVIGKPRQIFSATGAAQGSPSFSPDGKKIAFVSNKDGTPRIYIMDIPPAGTSLKQLNPKMITKKTRDNTSPAWSPDGKKIAYCALSAGTRQIWVYDLVTGEETQITDGYGHKENPAWAPNSQHIVFNSSTDKTAELYMIHLNQKKAVKITSGPGEKRFPAWESFIKRQLERKI